MGWDCLAYKSCCLLLVARSDDTTGSRNIKPEVVFKVQKMARYALFCFIMGPFNHFLVPELSVSFVLHVYSAPPGMQYIAVRGVSN